ncbi:MAG: DNA repair protein RadC [Balneolales bacterium]|nr:DNA repair protein RadC [Balneolales bacterium]
MMEILQQDDMRVPVRVVKDMPPDEQPREKLVRHGSETLSNAELLAILLRTGTKRMNVIDTSRNILEMSGGLHAMARKGLKDLCRVDGIGSVKAVTILAALELGRRLQSASLEEKVFFKSPEDVYAYFGPKMRDLRKEVFVVAFMNASKRLIGFEKMSVGGQTATIVDPSEAMRQAILNDAHSVVLLHNHPSGNAAASQADIQLTKRLYEAGRLLGVMVEDHIIVAGYEYVSLRSKGLLG